MCSPPELEPPAASSVSGAANTPADKDRNRTTSVHGVAVDHILMSNGTGWQSRPAAFEIEGTRARLKEQVRGTSMERTYRKRIEGPEGCSTDETWFAMKPVDPTAYSMKRARS